MIENDQDYSSEELDNLIGAGQVRLWIQRFGEPVSEQERVNHRFFVAEEIKKDFYSFFRIINSNGKSLTLTESFISENSIKEGEL